jgi:hypothetical protein
VTPTSARRHIRQLTLTWAIDHPRDVANAVATCRVTDFPSSETCSCETTFARSSAIRSRHGRTASVVPPRLTSVPRLIDTDNRPLRLSND